MWRRQHQQASAAATVADLSGEFSVGPAAASTYPMAKVKLGRREFDVNSEVIHASVCGVSDVDCAAFAARIKTGKISRVKQLLLVRFVFFTCGFPFVFSSMHFSIDARFTEQQPNRRQRSEVHSCCFAADGKLVEAGPCKMNFWDVFFTCRFPFVFSSMHFSIDARFTERQQNQHRWRLLSHRLHRE